MMRNVMQRQMFVGGGVANAQEAKQRSLIINQIISIAERTNRPLDPDTVTYLQNLSTPDLIKFRDTVIRQNPYPTSSQEPRERSEIREKYGGPERQTGLPVPAPSMRKGVEEQRYDQFRSVRPTPQPESGGRPTPDVYSGNVGDVMGEDYKGKEHYLVPGQQMPKRPRYERDEYIIQGNIPNPYFEQGMESDLRYLSEMRRRQALDMAGGGEAVPNQYKGFSKLPENVQQKMNPALAKRYQQGGIASMMDPASIPQGNPMAGGQMDPAQMAMMEAEQAGRAQGEQIGAMVGEQTMMGLDQADDFKGAIDAIRGNNAPLEARYQELSEYVGPQDAMQTPESVLAMVQPTIMMTEEGAVDSGIGQLMQQITGNTAMETPDGQPTAMAEGVGSLMGVGQQPAEKKLLADGGAVQSFEPGGEVLPVGGTATPMLNYQTSQLPKYLQETQKFYKDILGDPQEQKKAMQANILFSFADRGLALAGGVDPRTGESMAGQPFLSQLGRAGAGLGGQIGEQLAQQRALEQNIGLQALKSAEAKEAAEKLAIRDERAITLKNINDLQKMDVQNEFVQGERESAQEFKLRLEKALADYRNVQQDKNYAQLRLTEQVKSNLKKDVLLLQDKLKKANDAVARDFRREELDIISSNRVNEINASAAQQRLTGLADFQNNKALTLQTIDINFQNAKELAEFKADLSAEAQRTQNSFTAGLDYLRRQDAKNLMVDRFELEKALTLEIKKMDIGEEEKNRAIKEMQIRNTAIFQQQSLNIEKFKNAWEKEYDNAVLGLKEEQLKVDKAAANVKDFGNSLDGIVMSIVSDQTLLNKYADNSFTQGDGMTTSTMETAFTNYVTPKTLRDPYTNEVTFNKPAQPLTVQMQEAIKKRIDAGLPVSQTILNVYNEQSKKPDSEKTEPRKVDTSSLSGLPSFYDPTKTIEAVDTESLKSDLFKGVADPASAFGSPSFIQNIINTGVEALSFGKIGPIYEDTKRAVTAVNNLNDDFIKVYMKASGIRDSVWQSQELKALTPASTKFWQGDSVALEKAKSLSRRIQIDIKDLNKVVNDPTVPKDDKSYLDLKIQLTQLKKLYEGYSTLSSLMEGAKDPSFDELDSDQQDLYKNLQEKMEQ